MGSRGDFAQIIAGEALLAKYLEEVSQYYDSVLIQPIATGDEYRIFLLDDDVVYCARKHPPSLVGDGVSTIRDLLARHDAMLQSRGLSSAAIATDNEGTLNVVLPNGERSAIPGRMNLSAGGTMVLEPAPAESAVAAPARRAVKALGLRVAAVDLFTDIEGEPDAMRVIEVNSNPSIRLLEQSNRGDLILKIWHHTFAAMGLI